MDETISTGLGLALSTEPDRRYSVIMRYTGDFAQIREVMQAPSAELLNGFAVAYLPGEMILRLAELPQILYIDITRRMEYEQAVTSETRVQACFPVRNPTGGILRGNRILIGIVDSGVDLLHPDFLREDGNSRFLTYWDQTTSGNPPVGYGFGTEYNAAQIAAIVQKGRTGVSFDPSGHGTAVAGIAASLSTGADLIAVATLPDTAAFLCAADYLARYAQSANLPLVLNLSYGNNYGDHMGNAMTEIYLNLLSASGRFTVVCGMGNEGATGRHRFVRGNDRQEIGIDVGAGLRSFNLQLWSEWGNPYRFRIRSPRGETGETFASDQSGTFSRFFISGTEIEVMVGKPTPYNGRQEIFLVFRGEDIPVGVWTFVFFSDFSREYRIDAWLPAASATSGNVVFETPTVDRTLTIPASATDVISVAAYDSRLQTAAVFSGRGGDGQKKPDLAAPGVAILTANSGGGYVKMTGTSFATPFVTAACANLMQWGITDGHDPFLYGQRLKAYLKNGAVPLPGTAQDNIITGSGSLCASGSLPVSSGLDLFPK